MSELMSIKGDDISHRELQEVVEDDDNLYGEDQYDDNSKKESIIDTNVEARIEKKGGISASYASVEQNVEQNRSANRLLESNRTPIHHAKEAPINFPDKSNAETEQIMEKSTYTSNHLESPLLRATGALEPLSSAHGHDEDESFS
eukprot:5912893-Ditylum_brightwellii.AAC.1